MIVRNREGDNRHPLFQWFDSSDVAGQTDESTISSFLPSIYQDIHNRYVCIFQDSFVSHHRCRTHLKIYMPIQGISRFNCPGMSHWLLPLWTTTVDIFAGFLSLASAIG